MARSDTTNGEML